ncbi:MAG: hypothetical protein MPI95_02085 [Nitrosopumilus sp.]|nr:hypothetical protein [Nitrosopumilus sp.]CAI9831118.1 hypothetical protein IBTHAUMO2_170053 [Nitrosopumilaceae archaeon]MDA7941204.1 hypothetical protein [Nitrosopumilus sp.]MDA7942397.1 hypothetical protein [Nitrosopumilus sp.]MDA7944881.1 hypothetical protein [Nitrosopumilus sp.]
MATERLEKPSALWYLGHLFLGIITGLICYLIWRERNNSAATRHLIASIVLTIVPALIVWGIYAAILGAALSGLPGYP